MANKNQSPKVVAAGARAIELAEQGKATLYVRNDQRGWVPGGPNVLERARRMHPDSLWIYGAVLTIS